MPEMDGEEREVEGADGLKRPFPPSMWKNPFNTSLLGSPASRAGGSVLPYPLSLSSSTANL